MKNIVKEERALDALISVTLLPTSKSIEESIGKMESIREEDVDLSEEDEKALADMGNSPFDEEMQKEIYTNEYSIPEPTVKSTEAVFAMGRDGDTTEINEEIKKEIEKRRKRILDELKKKNKDAEKE